MADTMRYRPQALSDVWAQFKRAESATGTPAWQVPCTWPACPIHRDNP
jgi:hypothetical protein